MCAPTPQAHHDDMTDATVISLRSATAADAADLSRIAQLDSARPLQTPAVLALVDGRPVAAASLRDGRVVADPFTDSVDVVALLRARVRAAAERTPRRRRHLTLHRPTLRPAA
jgi:hypothetical protein